VRARLRRIADLFVPTEQVRHISDVAPARLAAEGVHGVILDLDNTLIPWHGLEASEEVHAWLDEARAANVRLCLLSNTTREARVREICEQLLIPYILPGGKPGCGGFQRAMSLMGTGVHNTAVIGDQLLTDVLGGNRCGLRTILVEPLSTREFWGTRLISRKVERLILKRAAPTLPGPKKKIGAAR